MHARGVTNLVILFLVSVLYYTEHLDVIVITKIDTAFLKCLYIQYVYVCLGGGELQPHVTWSWNKHKFDKISTHHVHIFLTDLQVIESV